MDKYQDYIALSQKNLLERVKELESVLQYVHKDLLLRADTDDNGNKVVSVGFSCWLSICKALKIKDK